MNSILLVLCVFLFLMQQNISLNVTDNNPYPALSHRVRMVIASCNYQHFKYNQMWSYMVNIDPDLIILLGDTVYLDAKPSKSCAEKKDMSCFNYEYDDVNWYENPLEQYYVLLNDSNFTLTTKYANHPSWPPIILPTWDDHDYCYDNSNASCPYKNITKSAFLYFFEQINVNETFNDTISEIRERSGGIYYYYDYVKTFDDNTDLKLRFYMLDGRYYRTKHDMLGSEQTIWLQNLLLSSTDDIDYHLLITGTTYFPTFGVAEEYAETWGDYHKEWLWNITEVAGLHDKLIILSGDVHYSALYNEDQVFEIVSSSLTHSVYDAQRWVLEKYNQEYLVRDNIINDENFAVLDLGIRKWELLFIDDDANIIVNTTYDYTSDELTYHNSSSNIISFNIITLLLIILSQIFLS